MKKCKTKKYSIGGDNLDSDWHFDVDNIPFPNTEDSPKKQKYNGGTLEFNPFFKMVNGIAQSLTFLSNANAERKQRKKEYQDYLKELIPAPQISTIENGLNNIPMYAIGGNNKVPIANLEKGEIYKDIYNNIKKISENAPTHENGGVNINDVSTVLEDTSDKRNDVMSQELKLTPEEVHILTGFKPKSSVTHSKAFELASTYWDRKYKALENKTKESLESSTESNSSFSKNALDFNMQQLKFIPTKEDLYNSLFSYQEQQKEKQKYTNIFKDGGINKKTPYKNLPEGYGDITKLQDYIKAYNEFNKTNFTSIGQIQSHRNNIYPELVKDYYRNQGTPPTNKHLDVLKQFGVDTTNGIDMTSIDDSILASGDIDKLWGNRQILPQVKQFKSKKDWQDYVNSRPIVNSNNKEFVYDGNNLYTTPIISNDEQEPIEEAPQEELIEETNKKSKFNEPLRWYDVASGLNAYINSDRIPVKLDKSEITYHSPKYINPTPQLQEGVASYNTMLQQLPNNGVGMANAASVFSSKYKTDNQVLGQTENANNQIFNNWLQYEDQMRNARSQNDFNARQMFEQKYLTSLEKQRQQRHLSFGDLMNTLAQNRKLNREGNLVMEMFDFYNQYGQYNGNKYNFTSNNSIDQTIKTDSKGKKYFVDPVTKTITPLK